MEIFSETLQQAAFDPLPNHSGPNQSHLSKLELVKEYSSILITGASTSGYMHTQLRNIPELLRLALEPLAEIPSSAAAKYDVIDSEKIVADMILDKVASASYPLSEEKD